MASSLSFARVDPRTLASAWVQESPLLAPRLLLSFSPPFSIASRLLDPQPPPSTLSTSSLASLCCQAGFLDHSTQPQVLQSCRVGTPA